MMVRLGDGKRNTDGLILLFTAKLLKNPAESKFSELRTHVEKKAFCPLSISGSVKFNIRKHT